MEGVVTILSDPYYRMVEAMQREVAEACELHSVRPTDIPHFSWHVAESYREQELAPILQEVCAEMHPFTVKTVGLGVFMAEESVLYIPLVADLPLLQFHQRLWQRLEGVGEGVNPYYAPGNWVPHITLAHEGLGVSELSCAVRMLAEKSPVWEMQVDHLAVIGETGLGSGKSLLRFPFGGKL